jgi:hypothetical protein
VVVFLHRARPGGAVRMVSKRIDSLSELGPGGGQTVSGLCSEERWFRLRLPPGWW